MDINIRNSSVKYESIRLNGTYTVKEEFSISFEAVIELQNVNNT